MKSLDEITGMVVDAAVKIHREFGPGLLESVYEKILMAELEERGLKVECQKPLSLTYAGRIFNEAYRVDMLVEDAVIIELKSTSQMASVFPKQLRTYLVLSNLKVGLLLNFGMNTMKEGIIRVVNNYTPQVSSSQPISASSAFSAGGKTSPNPHQPSILSAASAFTAGGIQP
jgi:iron complex transport system substrate-binding protein